MCLQHDKQQTSIKRKSIMRFLMSPFFFLFSFRLCCSRLWIVVGVSCFPRENTCSFIYANNNTEHLKCCRFVNIAVIFITAPVYRRKQCNMLWVLSCSFLYCALKKKNGSSSTVMWYKHLWDWWYWYYYNNKLVFVFLEICK